MRAWERMPGESPKAFAAFCAYRDLGHERSVEKAYEQYSGKPPTNGKGRRAPGYFRRWSERFDWVGRVQALEDFIEMEANAAVERRAKEKAEELAEISADVQERTLKAKQEYLHRVEQMAMWPIQESYTSKDGKIVIIRPAKWDFHTLNRALQMLADDPSQRRSLTNDPEWQELKELILDVLERFPDAKRALLHALSEEP